MRYSPTPARGRINVGMTVVEFTAVEHFAHALAAPGDFDVRADIEARTQSLTGAVDRVIERFSPSPELTEAAMLKRLKVVEGLIAMISQGIDAQAETIRAGEGARPVPLTDALIEAHDAMVNDYYRLLGLRSQVDPANSVKGPPLSGDAFKAWLDEVLPV